MSHRAKNRLFNRKSRQKISTVDEKTTFFRSKSPTDVFLLIFPLFINKKLPDFPLQKRKSKTKKVKRDKAFTSFHNINRPYSYYY